MGTRALHYLREEHPQHEVHHSPPPTTAVKNMSIHLYGVLLKHRDIVTLLVSKVDTIIRFNFN